MRPRTTLRALTLIIAASASSPVVHAQYREPKPCLPYGTFADELSARKAEREPPPVKFRIAKVEIRGAVHMPNSEVEKLVALLKRREYEDNDSFIPNLGEIDVRAFWQDRGYFRVQAKVDAQVYGNPADRKVAVSIRVEEGKRYRLRDISFINADDTPLHFPQDVLRKLIPLRDGEIFNVHQIRKGLDALRELYGEVGYIDFTSEPRTEEHETAEISLMLRLNQEQQFRIARITVPGLAPEKQAQLKWRIKEGGVFNHRAYEAFFKDNRHLLPVDAEESNVEIRRNLKDGLLTLTYNFERCAPYPFAVP